MFKKAFMVAGLLIAGMTASTAQAAHHGRTRLHHERHVAHAAGQRHAGARRVRLAHRAHRGAFRVARRSPAVGGGLVQTGRASFYSGGGRTANGGSVGMATCAHRSLPFGTRVLVTNLANLHRAVLTVNDRGPFVGGRVVDVSRGAAGMLGMIATGVANVRLQVLGRAG